MAKTRAPKPKGILAYKPAETPQNKLYDINMLRSISMIVKTQNFTEGQGGFAEDQQTLRDMLSMLVNEERSIWRFEMIQRVKMSIHLR